jgi:hypothetical protein
MKIIREVYLYSDTHLPTHGWLQGCWECETITSRLKTYKEITKNKKEEFNTKCNEFIDDHLNTSGS